MKPLISYNYAEIGRRTGRSRQFISYVFRGERKMPGLHDRRIPDVR